MSLYHATRKCAKCRQYKTLSGGHQKVIPNKGMYFVCAECKPFMKQGRTTVGGRGHMGYR